MHPSLSGAGRHFTLDSLKPSVAVGLSAKWENKLLLCSLYHVLRNNQNIMWVLDKGWVVIPKLPESFGA